MPWRRFLPSNLLGRGRDTPLMEDSLDFFQRPADLDAQPDTLDQALAEVERGALDVYAAVGLPTEPGHYRRDPNSRDWIFIATELSPAARFQLTLDHPPEDGWRFARLQDLGAHTDRTDVLQASRLLNEVAELRAARGSTLTRDHLLLALNLGDAWGAFRKAPKRPARGQRN